MCRVSCLLEVADECVFPRLQVNRLKIFIVFVIKCNLLLGLNTSLSTLCSNSMLWYAARDALGLGTILFQQHREGLGASFTQYPTRDMKTCARKK